MKFYKKGVTLTEILVVAAIFGILAMVTGPLLSGMIRRSIRKEALAHMETIRQAERRYFNQHGKYYGFGVFSSGGAEEWYNTPFGLPGINPGDLNGVYFDENCYTVKAMDSPVFGHAVVIYCLARGSAWYDADRNSAPRADRVNEWVVLWMNNDGSFFDGNDYTGIPFGS